MMRILLFLMLASNVSAQTPCCVDEDIAAAFLPYANFSRERPKQFAIDVDLPNLEYIGSNINLHANLQSAVAWQSELDAIEARHVVAEAFLAQGWMQMSNRDTAEDFLRGGFVTHQPLSVGNNGRFCKDGEGMMGIRSRKATFGTVVTVSLSQHASVRNCTALVANSSSNTGVMRYLPTLRLPESTSLVPYAGSGRGGGGDDAHASMTVKTALSASEMLDFFVTQMTDQAWQLDTGFGSSAASGHVWRRQTEGLALFCMLLAIPTDNDKVRLKMHLEVL